VLHKEGLDDYLADHLRVEDPPDLSEWQTLVANVEAASDPVTIAIVGKYVNLHDAYLSVMEALAHGGFAHGAAVDLRWIASDELASGSASEVFAGVDGVLVPGGFGIRGIEGKIEAIRYAREQGVPFLGICLGLQCAVVEFARNVCGLEGANSSEFDPATPHPVIDLLPEQKDITDMGATMRLGAQPCHLVDGTRAAEAYGEPVVYERHRHRFEVNNMLRKRLEAAGLRFSGTSPDDRLVEVIELSRETHPFFVASQYHPEFKSRPDRPAPLFREFVRAAAARARGTAPEGEPSVSRAE
jgi:CTP synthase